MSTAEKIQAWRARLAPAELVGSMPEANAVLLDLLEIIEQQEKRIKALECRANRDLPPLPGGSR